MVLELILHSWRSSEISLLSHTEYADYTDNNYSSSDPLETLAGIIVTFNL